MPRKVQFPEGLRLESAFPMQGRVSENEKYKTITRNYELVTPLFGGGVETRLADPVTTVRASEIKGQLRFWWRAVCGWRAEGKLEKLLELEESIWGGVTRRKSASKVHLVLEIVDHGQDKKPFELVPGKNFPKNLAHIAPGYLAFPLQPTKRDRTIYPVRTGVRFKLTLTFPKSYKKDVVAALWAWETFGGVGGRTRRGFGAVVREGSKLPSLERIKKKLELFIQGDAWPNGVPHLHPDGLFYLFSGSWQELAEAYKNFRQWRDGPRGRSKWPEPDEIRRLVGTHSPGHEPRHPVRKFPRGQFGLPIVFHFKDEKRDPKDKKHREPPDSTLKGETLERLASPLGFKPLSKKGPVLVYVLEGNRRLPEPYVLEVGGRTFNVEVLLDKDEALKIEPLKEAGGEPDPVKAFIKWLKKGGR